LSMPNLVAYPSDAPLPYQLRIIIQSAILPSTSHAAVELPEAPVNPAHLKLHLVRRLDVEANHEKAYVLSPRPIGGLGSTFDRASVRAKVAAPTFVPSPDGTSGTWQRFVRYEGILTFADTPSFSSRAVSVSHSIHLHVPIPGTTTALVADWDVTVSSGMEAAPPTCNFGTTTPPP
jgi:hypothetical protein